MKQNIMSRNYLLNCAVSICFLLSCSQASLLGQELKTGSGQTVVVNTVQRPSTNWDYYLLSQLQFNPELMKQLELSDGQQEKLKTATKDMQAEQTEMMKNYQEAYKTGNYQQAQADYMKNLGDFQTRFVETAGEILLEHQMNRLKQISRQQQASYSRGSWSSTSRYYVQRDMLEMPVNLAKELELSDEEVAKLKEEIEKNRKELAEEVKRLQDKAMENVLGTLSAKKREKLKEMIGEPYDFQAAQRATTEMYQKQYQQRLEEAKKKEEQK